MGFGAYKQNVDDFEHHSHQSLQKVSAAKANYGSLEENEELLSEAIGLAHRMWQIAQKLQEQNN